MRGNPAFENLPGKRKGEQAIFLGADLVESAFFGQLILLWMLISGCASAGFNLLNRVVVHSADRLNVSLVLSLSILPVNGGMILGPLISSFLAVPDIRGVYPAAIALNLIALADLILASRLPMPGKV